MSNPRSVLLSRGDRTERTLTGSLSLVSPGNGESSQLSGVLFLSFDVPNNLYRVELADVVETGGMS